MHPHQTAVSVELEELGWSDHFEEAFAPHRDAGLIPARVAVRPHGPCVLLTQHGSMGGLPAGRVRDEDMPAVGDWVAARPLPGERKAVIEAVLPRRSAFVRKEAWRRMTEQVVAANVDVVFLVTSFGHDLNPRRMERYLIAAWESSARPVIVVTKADLAADAVAEVAPLTDVAYGVPVHVVSNVSGDGLDELAAYLVRGHTAALLGSSGVGKSSLVNRLSGRELLATRDVRSDGRGRHTTTHRELVRLPGGALLLDTPGMRELQLWAGEGAVDGAFGDVAELAARCRFADCRHETEPGCAVREALATGALDTDRFRSYEKLQRELRHLELKQDETARLRARSERRREQRRLERSRRRAAW